ncbi:Bcr/CflA family efflux MFS transporter [Sphingosinicella terrae]|uniref:Bcr/CflA family efflux MFS transporter n=1 Tax=Sphingosinicella terrae TaxID=2172047 RepID=UPI0013B462B4|nr:Bcr/CflA family efflux MFS transporter [Sphingosinicella terrae]
MSRRVAFLLVLLSALGSLGIHAFVPALPAVSAGLGAPVGLVQLGITLYLAGLIVGQLVGGWTSDLVGRRPILVAGAGLYVAGAALCAAAPDITAFLLGRVVQGCGGACALVVSRAVVVDLSRAEETAAELARLSLVVLLAPTLAPLLGGLLVSAGGWRLIFAVLALAGSGALAATWLALPETGAARRAGETSAFAAFPRLLADGRFMRFTAINAIGTIGMFGFLAGASFLLVDLYGLDPAGTGIAFLCVAASVMAGTLLCGRIETRRPGQALRWGTATFALGGLIMLGLAGNAGHPAALIGPMMVSGFGAGLTGPSALAGALRVPEPAFRGTASSLFGALQMLMGAAATGVMAAFYRPTVYSVALPLAGAGLVIALLAWTAPRRPAA